MKTGIFILLVVFTVGLIVGAIIMAIKFGLFRNPFKDKWEDGKMMSQRRTIYLEFFSSSGWFTIRKNIREFSFLIYEKTNSTIIVYLSLR